MKKITLYIVGLLAVMRMITSCEQYDAETYQNDPRIYFYQGESGGDQQDSVKHSFFLVPTGQDRDTVWVDVRTMGLPVKDKSRSVKIVQGNAGQAAAAVAGKHYIAFDDPVLADRMVVQADSVHVMIPVILLRDPSLNSQKVRIEMEIAENENFLPGIDKNRKFTVQTTAMAETPGNWANTWVYYFGVWGSQKMWFIVNYLGYNEFDEVPAAGYRDYLKLKAREKLIEYNQNHKQPLCENTEKVHAPGEVCPDCVVFP